MPNKSNTSSISNTVSHATDVVADVFHDTGVMAHNSAESLGHLAEAVAADTQEGFRQLVHQAEGETSKVVNQAREAIQLHPNLTVGLAAGFGMLLGIFLSARR